MSQSHPANLDPEILDRAQSKLLLMLGERAPSACAAHVVSSGLIASVYFRYGAILSPTTLGLVIIWIGSILRFICGRRLLETPKSREIYVKFGAASIAQSLGWVIMMASLVIIFGAVHPLAVLALLTGSAIATGATVSLGSDLRLSSAFLILIIATMFIVLLVQGTLESYVLAGNVFMYLLFMLKQLKSQNSTLLLAEYWRIEAGSSATKLVAAQTQANELSKYAAIGELAAGMAHEVNNPLTILDGYTRTLEKKINPDKQQDYSKLFAVMQVQIKRIAGVVHGFLQYSSIDHSKMDQTLAFGEILNESIQNIMPEIAHGKRRLFLKAPDVSLQVKGNRDALLGANVGLILHASTEFPGDHDYIFIEARGKDSARGDATVRLYSSVNLDNDWKPYEIKPVESRQQTSQAHWIGLTTVRELLARHNITVSAGGLPLNEYLLTFRGH
jgi:signal transduction histidine kinase